MHLAEPFDGGIGGALQFGLQRHVGAHAGHIGIGRRQPRHFAIERVLFDIGHHHLYPGLRQRFGNAQPDARCRARDEGDLAHQILHAAYSLLASRIGGRRL